MTIKTLMSWEVRLPLPLTWFFSNFLDGLDFNLSDRPAESPLWNKYDKNWMIATMSLYKPILSDNEVFIVFSAIDMQSSKVLNSTLHNINMKALRTFMCLNSYMGFKNPECPTYTVSIIHYNCFYVIILVLFVLYIVLTQFIFFCRLRHLWLMFW